MKKSHLILLFTCSIAFLFSCGPQKKGTEQTTPPEPDPNEIRSLPDYAYTDSLTQGSHKIVFSITSAADSSLKVVEDEDGIKFMDNRFRLEIKKDGAKLFDRSFSKADFKSHLPNDFQKYGIMDGMRFHHAEEGKLFFSTCVSFPDSDMSCPFILTIGPDGSYSIVPDTSEPDEDELPPSAPEEAN